MGGDNESSESSQLSKACGNSAEATGGHSSEGSRKAVTEHDKSTADLDRVTDHVEERDIDSAALKDSMQAVLENTGPVKKNAKAKRDRELAKVKIQQADVDHIMEELELDSKTAERALREAGGNFLQALCALVD